MKRFLPALILLFGVTICNGQSISKKDSLLIMKALNNVFKNFKNPDFVEFQKISTKVIYCIICEDSKNSKLGIYDLKRNDFFNKHLKAIKNSESWKRASKSKEIILYKQNSRRADVIAFLTTWKANEYALGHEGAQLGIYFIKENGVFKFSGLETIP
ncbi:hypothetical protein [Arcicella rosea]|uniref:Uncharacterized protein n=1 Tax=Arcicella rosea TaxID=502909 RepID=A0A841EKH4_9BACT|nr:hypothetical protein [Arcicella rosea]MBB6002694.1 hypothetical protein [Arcicella rosea]